VLWSYRRIVAQRHTARVPTPDVSMVIWPQNDYWLGSIVDVPDETRDRHVAEAKQLSLSLLYWLQTEAPRPDGGTGLPRPSPAPDVFGTADGLAIEPYVRESRRIRARFTVREQDLAFAVRGEHGAVRYPDSVGIGMYRIDLHPSTGGDSYIDLTTCPFQIPLGALVPERIENLLPACKNIGTTHITNGAYRLHPIEWNVGEVAALLADRCLRRDLTPQALHADPEEVAAFQGELVRHGIELEWPRDRGVLTVPGDAGLAAADRLVALLGDDLDHGRPDPRSARSGRTSASGSPLVAGRRGARPGEQPGFAGGPGPRGGRPRRARPRARARHRHPLPALQPRHARARRPFLEVAGALRRRARARSRRAGPWPAAAGCASPSAHTDTFVVEAAGVSRARLAFLDDPDLELRVAAAPAPAPVPTPGCPTLDARDPDPASRSPSARACCMAAWDDTASPAACGDADGASASP
jgi:hypothetical protein